LGKSRGYSLRRLSLDSIQLNAVAKFEDSPLEGSYNYQPASGTILGIGNGQNLSVEFTPTDSTRYNSASATVLINVLKPSSYNVDWDELASLNLSQALIPEKGKDYQSTSTLTATGDITINIPTNGGISRIILPAGTVISAIDGQNIDGSVLTAANVEAGSISGLASGSVVDGILQWGIVNLGLQFTPAITLKIFVGEDHNGQNLSINRSTSGNSDWTNDGISPTTCLVANGYCEFTATKASYYSVSHTAVAANNNPATGGGGGGGTATPTEPGINISLENNFEPTTNGAVITWQTDHQGSSYVIYAREGEKHALNLLDVSGTPPKYGYERTTPEYDLDAKVIDHIVALTGLDPNTIYYYRVVSHGSLVIGDEKTFRTKPAEIPNEIIPPVNGPENNQPNENSNVGPLPVNGGQTPENQNESNGGNNTQPGNNEVANLPVSGPSNASLLLANLMSFGSGNNWISYLGAFIIYLFLLALAYFSFTWFAKYRRQRKNK